MNLLFPFMVWHDILVNTYILSKMWHSVNLDLRSTIEHFEVFVNCLCEYGINESISVLASVSDLTDELGSSKELKQLRNRKKKSLITSALTKKV